MADCVNNVPWYTVWDAKTGDLLAAKAGIVPRTLRKRFAAPESCGTWNWEEITAICRELHIPQEQIGEYFFPKVEKGA